MTLLPSSSYKSVAGKVLASTSINDRSVVEVVGSEAVGSEVVADIGKDVGREVGLGVGKGVGIGGLEQ